MKKFHFISKHKTPEKNVKETDGTFWQVIVDTVCTILFPKSKVMIKNNLQSLLKIIKIVINLYNLSVYKISHNRVSKLDSKNKSIKLHILKSKTKPQKLNKSQKKNITTLLWMKNGKSETCRKHDEDIYIHTKHLNK